MIPGPTGRREIETGTARRIAATLVVVAFVATAGCAGVLSEGDQADTAGDPIEYVPQDQTTLIHVDGDRLGDQPARDLLASMDDDQAPLGNQQDTLTGEQGSPGTALSAFEAQTGLDSAGVDQVVLFGDDASGSSVDDAEESASDFGVVVQTSWDEATLLGAIRDNESVDLTATSYQGQDVLYEVRGSTGDRDGYVGVLGNGTYVIGTESRVTESLDVAYGDASAVSGDLREAYENRPDGLVSFAMVTQSGDLGSTGVGGGQTGIEAETVSQQLESITGALSTDGSEVRFETRLGTASQEVAGQVQSTVQMAIAIYGEQPGVAPGLGPGTPAQLPQYATDALQYVSVEQNGTAVSIAFEATAQEIARLSESS